MNWYLKSFNELNIDELYQILKLRIDIFVVEQASIYSDLDNKDRQEGILHLFAEEQGQIKAYLRLLPPEVSYPAMSSLGRVVIHPDARGMGLGHELLKRALAVIDEQWPNNTCHISAQTHLQSFYNQHDYYAVGEGYLEDGIPHIGMERAAAKG
ncbi:GNAT family N-acetyltransferase [Endozoicomonas sp. SM1973]|uniref:GNAT family N-acetyltransferase n=1 Tax=Spartinivicinus marinus TaxID=2994442 RepID=A0A853I751_9GAMM|nr:GNAT family N-acetyltransferase [Spartinivicinus marinus]MCX4029818.1 GNAT family N-acetyltransferase [Spartinivicinus marinus]NYZ67512.1 GNAT family N-acetyltransferase [Spartinivicinus marinus]